VSEAIIAALISSGSGAAVSLHIYYDRKRPALEVQASPQEDYFKARITVHNRSTSAYSYKIKVDGTYLNWQKNETQNKHGDKTVILLAENYGSGVILDPVYDKLEDHDIVIECHGWRPSPWSKVVFRKRHKNI
jgi:hypothetical protein